MNIRIILLGILGFFGMGPLALAPISRYAAKAKTYYKSVKNQTLHNHVRIEEARQKRLRKQAKRLPPEMG